MIIEKQNNELYKDKGGGLGYEKSIHEYYSVGIVTFCGDGVADGTCCHSLTD